MVSSGVKKMVMPCWKAPDDEGDNGMLWYKDLGQHADGQFSMSVVQANTLLEDRCQLESGPRGTFVGIYDGHGGPETACFLNQHLFQHVMKYASDDEEMSGDVIRKAYSATEEAFLSLVQKQWLTNPHIASVGSCCLVGIISDGTLYIGNAGDSRVVLGRSQKDITAIQLSKEHNASIESVREELRSLHPDDSQIVVLKHKVWRVKGVIQVSRSIGDAYLKKTEFNREPLLPKFRLDHPFHKPILSYEPSVLVRKLQPEDLFLIFASDGLWEHLSNQEAIDIVRCSPRKGIARRLIKAALQEAAKKREMRYSDLKKIDCGVRRHFHDDISVIVLFLDSLPLSKTSSNNPKISIKFNPS
ncbi:[pyruvate dehydrogenase (acetyl-transferring)]-phosphatase [Ranunculus cassubicifolius]